MKRPTGKRNTTHKNTHKCCLVWLCSATLTLIRLTRFLAVNPHNTSVKKTSSSACQCRAALLVVCLIFKSEVHAQRVVHNHDYVPYWSEKRNPPKQCYSKSHNTRQEPLIPSDACCNAFAAACARTVLRSSEGVKHVGLRQAVLQNVICDTYHFAVDQRRRRQRCATK